MDNLSRTDSRHPKAVSNETAGKSKKRWIWLILLPITVVLLYATWTQTKQPVTPSYSAATQHAGDPSVPSRANLDWQLRKFEKSYGQLTGLRISAPHREQVTVFLSQAAQLKRSAEARYEASLEHNSPVALNSSLELALVVDAVEQVSNVLAKKKGNVSQSQLIRDTKEWLPRMEVVLQQDKSTLEFDERDGSPGPKDRDHLGSPDALYSEAALQVQQAQARQSAGDALGAWLSMVDSHMLLGVLAMRLSQSPLK